MKKALSLFLSLTLAFTLFALAGCNKNGAQVAATTAAIFPTAGSTETAAPPSTVPDITILTTTAPVTTVPATATPGTTASKTTAPKTTKPKPTTPDTTGAIKNSQLAEVAAQAQSILDKTNNKTLTINVSARGNTLVYTYKYGTPLSGDALQTALDSLDSTYTDLLKSVQTLIPGCESILLEFVDKNGKVLASKEYK